MVDGFQVVVKSQIILMQIPKIAEPQGTDGLIDYISRILPLTATDNYSYTKKHLDKLSR